MYPMFPALTPLRGPHPGSIFFIYIFMLFWAFHVPCSHPPKRTAPWQYLFLFFYIYIFLIVVLGFSLLLCILLGHEIVSSLGHEMYPMFPALTPLRGPHPGSIFFYFFIYYIVLGFFLFLSFTLYSFGTRNRIFIGTRDVSHVSCSHPPKRTASWQYLFLFFYLLYCLLFFSFSFFFFLLLCILLGHEMVSSLGHEMYPMSPLSPIHAVSFYIYCFGFSLFLSFTSYSFGTRNRIFIRTRDVSHVP
jgi:hypothetical protein